MCWKCNTQFGRRRDDPLGFLRPTSHRLTSLEVEETGIERNQHISHVAVDNDENFY
jgi:hypothetical protein